MLISNKYLWEKRVLWIIVIQIASYCVIVARNSLISHTASLELFGEFFLLLSVSNILLMIYSFGWPSLIVRELSKTDSISKKISALLPVSIIECTVIAVFVSIVVYFLTLYSTTLFNLNVKSASIVAFLSTIAVLLFSVFEGLRRVFFSKIASGIIMPIVFIVIVAITSEITKLSELVFIYCLAYIVIMIYVVLVLYRLKVINIDTIKKNFIITDIFKKNRVTVNAWLILATFSNLLLVSTDAIMLKIMSTDRQLGGYGLVSSIVAIVSLGIAAANTLYGPETGKQYKEKNWKEARMLFRKTQLVIFFWSALGLLILILFSKQIFTIASGMNDIGIFPYCMIVLGVGQFVNAITGPVATALFMFGKTRYFSISVFIASAANIIGNYILISNYGALGAAISTAIVIASLNVIQYFKAKEYDLV